jgi:hypothetical protein
MSQTMLSILALVLATMFAVQQQRHTAHTKLSMIRGEIGTQTTGVAVDRLEEIGAMAFDEATVGDITLDSPDSLTSGSPFGLDAPGNDIDDFDAVTLDTFRVAGNDTLRFRVVSRVRYANEADVAQEVGGPTKVKKATVKVYNLNVAAPDTITLSQSYACGSRCAW